MPVAGAGDQEARPPVVAAGRTPEIMSCWAMNRPTGGVTLGSGEDGLPPIVGTHFLWDGDVVAEEAPLRFGGSIDWADATRWHYEPESFRPLAKQTSDGRLLPIATDNLGTPREMFDEDGRVAWSATYTTWGVLRAVKRPAKTDDGRAIYPRASSGGTFHADTRGNLALQPASSEACCECPMRFPGQWEDPETGLAYNRFRTYDPVSHQYLSPDPIALAGGFRPQRYVTNPEVLIDPLGLSSTGKTYGPHDQGPLGDPNDPDSPAATFRGGSYTEKVAVKPKTLYRAYGGKAKARGQFWTQDKPQGPLQAQLDSALNPAWGNTATETGSITLPPGTVYYEGAAAPQSIAGGTGSLYGGGSQIYVPWSTLNKIP